MRQVPLLAWPRGPWQRRELVALGVAFVEHLQQGVLQPSPVEAERQQGQEVSLPLGPLQAPLLPRLEVLEQAELGKQPVSEHRWHR